MSVPLGSACSRAVGGHFTGRFGQIQGQTINFIATDIYRYRVADGRVAENWHIEEAWIEWRSAE